MRVSRGEGAKLQRGKAQRTPSHMRPGHASTHEVQGPGQSKFALGARPRGVTTYAGLMAVATPTRRPSEAPWQKEKPASSAYRLL